MRGLTQVRDVLGRRLRADSNSPLAVAFSGGGDSLALLLITAEWARAHGRRLLALTVDHGLQAESAGWTRRCGQVAASLGADFRALSWVGDKPAPGLHTPGLPAAARTARHALLADAAREAGAGVILMGHTADDLAEAALMRAQGSTTPDPREWAPSPAWPQGRGVFLLRPLLSARRADLRRWLAFQGHGWIDDPANEDMAYARVRARHALAGVAGDLGASPPSPSPLPVSFEDGGQTSVIGLSRDTSCAALAAACLCAGGTTRPPRGERLARLGARLATAEVFSATLGGARIEAGSARVQVCRDAGETARGGLAPIALTQGRTTVWDGRYEFSTDAPGLTVRPLKGLAARLDPAQKRRLAAIPAAARPGLPVIVNPSGTMICPILAEVPDVRFRALSGERFRAAVGLVERESRA